MFKKKKKKRNDEFDAIASLLSNPYLYGKIKMRMDGKHAGTIIVDELGLIKPKFNINSYKGTYVMHCETQEELFKFYDYLHSVGKKWFFGGSYKDFRPTVDGARRPICYLYFNDGTFGSYNNTIYTVLNFKDFDWSDSNMERKFEFNIGDKVRVAKTDYKLKKPYIGKIFTIESVNPNPWRPTEHYGFDSKLCGYVFDAEELILVEKRFTKADLKPGMVVELCDGDRYLFVNDKFANAHEWSDSKHYNNDLTHSVYENLNIVKVYTSTGHTLGTMLDKSSLTLVWERKDDVKEMTVAEIEKQLGYKVKIVDGE